MIAKFGKKAVVCMAICVMVGNSACEEVPSTELSDHMEEPTFSMEETTVEVEEPTYSMEETTVDLEEPVFEGEEAEVKDDLEQGEASEKSVNEELFPIDFMSLAKTLNPFNDLKRSLYLQHNFNAADFQGRWYEVARNVIASLTFELGCKDSYANYTIPAMLLSDKERSRMEADRREGDREREHRGGDREREHRGGDREREDRGGDREREDRGGDREREDRGGDREREDREGDREREDREGDREREDREGDREREDREGDREREHREGDREGEDRAPELFFPPLTPASVPYIEIVNTCTRLGVPSAVMAKGFLVSPEVSPGVYAEGRIEVKIGATANKLPTSCAANQTVACPGNYWVLWTDYGNLAVIGGPVPFGSVWFLSRKPEVQVSDILYMKMKALEAGVSILELLPGALIYSTPTSTKI